MILSFWNYLPLSNYKKNIVDDWAEIGSNVAMSFLYDKTSCSKKEMINFLDDCLKKNIKVLIVDKRTSFYNLDSISEDEFRLNVKEAYLDFGKHKATYGFFVGDEPDFDHIDNAIKAINIIKEECGGLVPFLNLLPYWNNIKEQKKYGRNSLFFEQIVEKIIKNSGVPVLGFDHYTQCYDKKENQEKGIEYFLDDLENYSRVCHKNNVDLFVTLLSVGHWNYRVPSFDDIRWQFNVSLAYGAKGILWFYFHQKSLDYSYRMSPFFAEDFIKTETFNNVKIVQRNFKENYEELFDSLTYVRTDRFIKKNKIVFNNFVIKCKRKDSFLITTFKKEEREILMLTNLSQEIANNFVIHNNESENNYWLAPGEFVFLDL